jgi:class 3 adenylate cyclase
VLQRTSEIDVRAALPAVSVPTLLVHRRGVPLIPLAGAEYAADRIPGARLVALDGDWHISGLPGEEDDALDAVEEFLTGRPAGPEHDADRVLATVLFTDVVGSTAQAAELGDRRWKARIAEHDRTAAEVERHRGTLVRVTGDGLLATFDGPGRCIRAAQALIEAVRPLGLELRAGVHTGEIDRLDHDVAGIAVHAGARIAALAGPGEVLVSSTVKDLVIGSGLEFEDRGVQPLVGVPGEWRLWRVR